MARGVVTPGDTREQAEASLGDTSSLRVLRSKRLDVSDLGPVRRGTMQNNWWVVVVEHEHPAQDPLPQMDDPEAEAEAAFRADIRRKFPS